MSKTAERLYTVKELSELTGVKERYIKDARTKYGLKSTQLDVVRISLRDWEAFVKERESKVS